MSKTAYKQAIKRDKHTCQMCGNTTIEVHHIVYRSLQGANIEENLICLCKHHHMLVHSNQEQYRPLLLDLQRRHYGILNIEDLKKQSKWKGFEYQ